MDTTDLPSDLKGRWSGYQAQHIIPKSMRNHPILQKIGMDLDNATNGIFLPQRKGRVSSALTKHQGGHMMYSNFVRGLLNNLDVNRSTKNLINDVHQIQTRLRKMQEKGTPIYPKDGGTRGILERSYNRTR